MSLWLRNRVMKKIAYLLLLVVVVLSGCRGQRSEKPAIHLNPNLDWQAKYKAQMFTQELPEGVVAWGTDQSFSDAETRATYLKEDSRYYFGKTASGAFVSKIPVEVTEAMMKRGQERYTIYCGMCHDQTGAGRGMVVKRGFPIPPSFHDDRLLAVEDGYVFDVITNGVRTMPAYRKQINEADRWAIVAYVRALQKMNTGSLKDVPESRRGELN